MLFIKNQPINTQQGTKKQKLKKKSKTATQKQKYLPVRQKPTVSLFNKLTKLAVNNSQAENEISRN